MTGKPQKLTAEQLRELTGLDDHLLDQLALWANKNLTCAHCGKCTLRCEVLKGPALDMGRVEADYEAIMARPPEERAQATIDYVTAHPDTYIALRSCCFCGFCTAQCQRHMLAPERMREWRQLFMQAGYMPPGDSTLVMVDNEWHIHHSAALRGRQGL